jgi:hypothetical protein
LEKRKCSFEVEKRKVLGTVRLEMRRCSFEVEKRNQHSDKRRNEDSKDSKISA